MSSEVGTPFHVWNRVPSGTWDRLRGAHPISGMVACQVRWVPHFMSEIGYPPAPEIGWGGTPYLRYRSMSSEVGTPFHVWNRVPSGTWDRLRGAHPISGMGACQVRWVPHFMSEIGYPLGPEIGWGGHTLSQVWEHVKWGGYPISCLK